MYSPSCAVQAYIDGFMTHLGVSEAEARSLIKLSVSLAREAKEEYMKENPNSAMPLIAGSVGPFGSEDFIGCTYTGKYVDKVTPQVCIYAGVVWYITSVQLVVHMHVLPWKPQMAYHLIISSPLLLMS